MNRTGIEYVDFTWNPFTGCLGPDGDGHRCSYCYAHRLAQGRLRKRYLENDWVIAGDPSDPFSPRYWPDRVEQPESVKKPSKIFVVDMGDLFGPWTTRGMKELPFIIARECPWHTFLFLTKWHGNLIEFNPWPQNCWAGVTATNQGEYNRAVNALAFVKAPVRFISFEPLLGPIDHLWPKVIDWIIIGAQTGPGAVPPEQRWVHQLKYEARRAYIPLFLKDNLAWGWPCQEYPVK